MRRTTGHSLIIAAVLTAALLLCGFSSMESGLFRPHWKTCRADATVVSLSGLQPEELEAAADVLRGLERLETMLLDDNANEVLGWDGITTLHEACPQADIDCDFTLFGAVRNLSDEELDIKHHRITDYGAEVRTIMSLMNNLRTVDMDSCGLNDLTMEQLRDDYPGVEVIWRITFGERYSVRTDTERILASAPDLAGELLDDNVTALKYCTKVKYLDIGHNNSLRELDFIRCMPDLEVAILAMSDMEDFSALAECPKLEYLELFTTRLHDLTPLSGLTNLRHLNICYNFALSDISPLYSLTKLERLWIGFYDPVPPEQIARMQELAPDCIINTDTRDPTDGGWRFDRMDGMGNVKENDRYALLRRQFGYEDPQYNYYWYDPMYYYD